MYRSLRAFFLVKLSIKVLFERTHLNGEIFFFFDKLHLNGEMNIRGILFFDFIGL